MSDVILKVENIKKRFGGLLALKGVDFSLSNGELLGLIGPNGAGKSVMTQVITGVYKPESGKVFFKGEDITGLRQDQIARKGISRTFQLYSMLPSLTVLDNITLGYFKTVKANMWTELFSIKMRQDTAKQAEELLDSMGLAMLGNNITGRLPIGTQKEIAVLCALVSKPELLILDEPLAGLNPAESDKLMNLVKKTNEGGTSVLIIDHAIKHIMSYCQRIFVLSYGEKIAEGTPKEIQANEKVIEAYLGA